MLPVWYSLRQGKASNSNLYTVGAMGDSFFEYLLKLWLLHQKQVPPPLQMSRMLLLLHALPWH